MKAMHEKAYETTLVKNGDYSPGFNPFSNFEKMIADFGEDFPEKLIIARISERVDRLVGLIKNGRSSFNSEKEDNDAIDIGNYAFILLAYRKAKKDDTNKEFSTSVS